MDFRDIKSISIGGQSIAKITDSLGNVIWKKGSQPTIEPFYIENTYAGTNTLTISKYYTPAATHFYWSKNGTAWNEQQVSALPLNIDMAEGEKVYLKGDEGVWNSYINYNNNYITITASQSHNVVGDIVSLLGEDVTSMPDYCFNHLFNGDTNLVDASELIMPDFVSSGCYQNMFIGCEALTTAPELPATRLESNCYYQMFANCTSLVNAPALPATTLASYCYYGMFKGCSALTTAPATLPATTLADGCYSYMFYGCSALETAPALPATTLANYCYSNMFSGCTKLTQAPSLPATTLASYCYQYMFRGCSSLNEIHYGANVAPSSTNSYCLEWVSGVASSGTFYRTDESWTVSYGVNGVPSGWTVVFEHKHKDTDLCLTNLTDEDNVFSCTYSGTNPTFYYETVSESGATLASGTTTADGTVTIPARARLYIYCNRTAWNTSSGYSCSLKCSKSFKASGNINSLVNYKTTISNNYEFQQLFYGSTNLVDASELVLPFTTLSAFCYRYMFKNCSSLVNAPTILPATTHYQCYTYMFSGCTSLTTAPALPATTLEYDCYCRMFEGCTSLTTAPELPATTLKEGCYNGMFYGCTKLNTIYYGASVAPSITNDYCSNWVNGVPSGGTFYRKDTSWTPSYGISGVPSGWTVTEWVEEE